MRIEDKRQRDFYSTQAEHKNEVRSEIQTLEPKTSPEYILKDPYALEFLDLKQNKALMILYKGNDCLNGQNRVDVKIGAKVKIVLKADQRIGRLTEGIVAKLLTKSSFHPHGFKVMLEDGQAGRVQSQTLARIAWLGSFHPKTSGQAYYI